MITREVVVPNRLGLHARAAAKFVQTAGRFRARILVRRESRTMDGKSIMGVLLLAAARGTTIAISAEGPDETEAVAALVSLVESGFGEEPWNG
jgi:phosphocarrier protein